LAALVLDRVERRPDARFGMADEPLTLSNATSMARRAAAAFEAVGIGPGARVAVVGETSNSYLVAWLALVFAGAEAALANPTYPADLLAEMLDDLEPAAVVWLHRNPEPAVAPGALHLDASGLDRGRLLAEGAEVTEATEVDGVPGADLPGLARRPVDVAGTCIRRERPVCRSSASRRTNTFSGSAGSSPTRCASPPTTPCSHRCPCSTSTRWATASSAG
jgi:non-ribosomal peptide synthetase component F